MRTLIIENSKAPQAIGDTLASFPAIHAAGWENPIQVYLSAEKVRPLLYHPKVTLLTERPEDGEVIDIQILFAKYAMSGMSMPRAYLDYIGYSGIAKLQRNPEIILNVKFDNQRLGKGYDLLVAPFSHSDNGTNTKIWYDYNWILLMNEFSKRKKKIGLLGTSKDNYQVFQDGHIDLILDKPLDEVATIIREARLVITVDNGMNWLAQATEANHILLLPNTQHPNWTANPSRNALNFPLTIKVEEVFALLEKRMAEVRFFGA